MYAPVCNIVRVPTPVMRNEVGVAPATTSTASKPATWKLATLSTLSTSRSFESTLPERTAASSNMLVLSAARTEGMSIWLSETVIV